MKTNSARKAMLRRQPSASLRGFGEELHIAVGFGQRSIPGNTKLCPETYPAGIALQLFAEQTNHLLANLFVPRIGDQIHCIFRMQIVELVVRRTAVVGIQEVPTVGHAMLQAAGKVHTHMPPTEEEQLR